MRSRDLPVYVDAYKGESLYGYYSRLADALFLPLSKVVPITRMSGLMGPGPAELQALSHDLGWTKEQVLSKTAASNYPALIHTTLRPFIATTGQRLFCPKCRFHRPEFDFTMVFGCPQCKVLLTAHHSLTLPLSEHGCAVNQRIINEMKMIHQFPLLKRIQEFSETLRSSIWHVGHSEQIRSFQKAYELEICLGYANRNARHCTRPLMAAIAIHMHDLEMTANKNDSVVRYRFESVAWSDARRQGAALLNGDSLDNYLIRNKASVTEVPGLLIHPTKLQAASKFEYESWCVLSVLLTRRIARAGNSRLSGAGTAKIFGLPTTSRVIRSALALDSSEQLSRDDQSLLAWAFHQARSLATDYGTLPSVIKRRLQSLRDYSPSTFIMESDQENLCKAIQLLFGRVQLSYSDFKDSLRWFSVLTEPKWAIFAQEAFEEAELNVALTKWASEAMQSHPGSVRTSTSLGA